MKKPKRNIRLLFNDRPDYVREQCRMLSTANPGKIVLGIYMFRLAHAELTDELRAEHVIDNKFAGYWRGGQFRLFSPAELALGEGKKDED